MMIKSKSRKIMNIIVVAVICACFALQMILPFVNYGANKTASIKTLGEKEYSYNVNNFKDISNIVTESLSNDAILEFEDEGIIDEDQEVWVIVEANDTSLLDTYLSKKRKESLHDFVTTEENMKYQEGLLDDHQRIYDRIKNLCVTSVKYNYTILLNGFSVAVKYKDVKKIENIPGVTNVIISEKYYPQQVSQATAKEGITENEVNVYDTGIYKSNTSYNGSGTIVAILDTGLDYTHSAFQKQPVGDVAYTHDDVAALVEQTQAYQLSASKENGAFTLVTDDVYLSKKVPFAYDYADKDANVYPTNDHGTHVAGIITGSDDRITGVATEAQLAIMKVFADKDEGAETADILSALQDCILLNVDVINMSLGTSCGFAREDDKENVNEIYDGIKAAGISLIVAASNDYSAAQGSDWGDTNLTSNPDSGTIGSPSTFAAAMSVASISGVKTAYFDLDGEPIYFTESSTTTGDQKHFMDEFLGSAQTKTADYVVIPGIGVSSDYIGIDVAGKVAVVKRGVNTFEEKILTAQSKGAIAIVIYNNQSGTISMSVGNKTEIPSCSISMDMGAKFEAKTEGQLVFSKENLAGPFMSPFSSWGVLPDLELKPDITAHGGDIESAVRGGYDRLSGTSMACPNMAGATLLVRQYVKERFPELSNVEVTELAYQLMMSTATIAYNEYGNPYSPRKQGAGIADILKTTTTPAYLWVEGINKTKISLGDDPSKSGHYVLKFNITNMSNKAQSYFVNTNLFTETVSTDGKTVAERAYMFNDYLESVSVTGAELVNNHVIVKGYDTATITVTIDLSAEDKAYLDQNFENGMYVEGYVCLTNDDANGIDLNIPYCGFYGDWTVAPILDYTAYELDASKFDSAVLDDDKLKSAAYGSIGMGGFRYQVSANEYKDAQWGLGDYGYNLADGYEKPQTMEEHAAISENIDALYEIRSIAAGLIRGAKSAHMLITDSNTGEKVYEDIVYDGRKSHFSGARTGGYLEMRLSAAEYGLKNNTKYTFYMECFLDWAGPQNNKKNVFTFDFYVDSESPVLIENQTKVRIKEDSKGNKTYYLDMYVYDNHYIQLYSIATFDYLAADGTYVNREALIKNTIPVDSAFNYTNRITLNITEYWKELKENNKQISVEFIDYARNASTYTFSLPDTIADSIEFTKESIDLKQNATFDLFDVINMTPADSFKHLVTFTSSDESVVRVHEGEVFGVGEAGSAVITATTENGASASITVNISGKKKYTPALEDLDFGVSVHRMDQGSDYVLNAECKPWYFEATDIEVEWKSNNNKIATVTVDPENPFKATVHATGEGSAVITCSKKNSFIAASIAIIVNEEFKIDGRTLTKYTGRGDENGVVVIPDDKGIIYINQYAFYDNDYITKIVVPEGVKELHQAAIYGCENLEEVILPKTMETIAKFGLGWNPNLKRVDLGGTKTIQDYGLVYDQSLTDIDLSNVRNIGYGGFYQCNSLKSIDISNCGGLGEMAFAYCSSLQAIKMTKDTSLQGIRAFYRCTGLTSLTIPTNYVAVDTFSSCTGLCDVTFTNAVTTIDEAAFADCTALKAITYLNTVNRIGAQAFGNCSNLTNVYLPAGLTTLDEEAFAYCENLERVIVSKDAMLKSLNIGNFADCDKLVAFEVEAGNKYLTAVDGILYDKSMSKLILVPNGLVVGNFVVPETVKVIGNYAFSYNDTLESINLANVETVEEGAFYFCTSLNNIESTKLTTIGKYALADCESMTTIYIPNTVKYVGDYAFAESCGKSDKFAFRIPANVEYLGQGAFIMNSAITNITFEEGSKLTQILDETFSECLNLTSVDFTNANIESLGSFVFAGCTALTSVKYPQTVKSLGTHTYAECESLTALNFPQNLTTIPAYTYAYATSLKALNIPTSVVEIGDYAFAGCEAMTGVNLQNVTSIGNYAFAQTALNNVSSTKVTEIGDYAFFDVVSLAKATFNNAVSVGNNAFYGCTKLSTVGLDKVEYIGDYAFATCSALTTISLPSCKVVGKAAFADSSLATITLPVLETVGSLAFANTQIQTFDVAKTVKYIGEEAFAAASKLRTFTVATENEVYFVDGISVLYRNLANGYYELVAYPIARTKTKYEVLADTVRIAASAFAYNKTLTEVELPDTLARIADQAFYETKITKYVFHSFEAPLLETTFIDEKTTAYKNFITEITNANSTVLTIVVPKNGYKYDSYLYTEYFDNVEVNDQDYAANQDTIRLKKLIKSLPQAIVTDADKAFVMEVCEMYEYLPKDMKSLLTEAEKIALANAQKLLEQLN